MTREVAIKGLKAFRKEFSGYEPNEEMFDMAIKALEQEPFINKPCVSSEVCEHDKNVVIDKIRAEIDKIYERESNSVDCLNALNELKWFIDKYKAESEDKG